MIISKADRGKSISIIMASSHQIVIPKLAREWATEIIHLADEIEAEQEKA